MTPPDPTDLRLVSALAELGRTTVLDLAARAGVHPEEAAVRLLRMGWYGIPLVVGVEGDRAGLYAWLGAQQGGVPPQPPLPQQGAMPQPPPMQQPPPMPQPPPMQQPPGMPPGPHAAGPQSQPGWQGPTPWGQPPAAVGAYRAPESPPANREPAGATTATVGDELAAVGPSGESVSITLVEVVDTADALIAAAGHHLTPGKRATVVHTEVTAGPEGFAAIADTGLTVVLGDGTEVEKSGMTLSSRPPFRAGIAAGDTVGGHTVFELDAQASIVGVRWRAAEDRPPLDWRIR
ncbi:AsnC family protein [Rhodococcus sp. X156]|uniref:AsnC family protein n=1 Tax=Rhodococcus sp. X156 TaxID=2499145 RepID=UPI000FDAB978|nr:AsnC family protein [Rhodococcus sp. X156]